MRVYVEELPDDCYCCVCNNDDWRCNINGESISHNGRREDCPLKVIVRCKDCKWAEKAILDEYCVECTMYHTPCERHGYCHNGERKGGDKE